MNIHHLICVRKNKSLTTKLIMGKVYIRTELYRLKLDGLLVLS